MWLDYHSAANSYAGSSSATSHELKRNGNPAYVKSTHAPYEPVAIPPKE